MLIYQLHGISWLLFSRSQSSYICVTTGICSAGGNVCFVDCGGSAH